MFTLLIMAWNDMRNGINNAVADSFIIGYSASKIYHSEAPLGCVEQRNYDTLMENFK